MKREVIFYQLNQLSKVDFCCKLALQLWRKKQVSEVPQIWFYCEDAERVSEMSQALMSFEQDSLIPLQAISQSYISQPLIMPFCIARSLPLPSWQGILFNFSRSAITAVNCQIIEAFEDNMSDKSKARELYGRYKKDQFTLKHFNIK